MRRPLAPLVHGPLIVGVLGALTLGCSAGQDDPPSTDEPAVVESAPDADPAPGSTPTTEDATTTTVALIDSIDGPVVVGSIP